MQEARVLERLRLEVTKIVEQYVAELQYFKNKVQESETKFGVVITDEEMFTKYAIICYKEALKKVESILEIYKNR